MHDVECISCSKFAAIVPRFTGGTSAISSSIIIFLIFRSEAKLGTIYHRVMFGMSLFDILGSVAISLTTLPMQKELPFDHPPYDGTRLGNNQTCQAQGFIITLGFIVVIAYNVMLFVYYTCAIAFQMEDKKIAKYVEPVLHISSVGFGLAVAIPPLVHDLYNPTDWDAWCTITASGREDIQFDETRINHKVTNIDTLKTASCSIIAIIIIASTILIMRKVNQIERDLNNSTIKRRSIIHDKATKSLQNTKIVFVQVMAYLSSFLITFGCVFLRSVINEPDWVIYLSFVLIPLQGFFNALIFISHKVYNYRRVYGDISRCGVIKLLFQKRHAEPFLFTRISLVRRNDDGKIADIELSNEGGNEVLHINKEDAVSASPQSQGKLACFDEESKQDLDGLSGFSSVADPISSADNYSRQGLSGFSERSTEPSANKEQRGSISPCDNPSPSINAEEDRQNIAVDNKSSRSVLSRLTWTSIRKGNRANNQSTDNISLEPSFENSVGDNEITSP